MNPTTLLRNLFVDHIAVDLGTVNTLICIPGEGVIAFESAREIGKHNFDFEWGESGQWLWQHRDSKRYYARVPEKDRSEVFVISEADAGRIVRPLAAFTGKK